jgi:hypothetical protein
MLRWLSIEVEARRILEDLVRENDRPAEQHARPIRIAAPHRQAGHLARSFTFVDLVRYRMSKIRRKT